ncbi:DUF3226 domain-containing protein [Hydrogenophaga sp.]|uniref:DUF3226 domain-containing protein n=1 Tax=Hydrogenophaga sp. TaxID=1904254 RepID=UPI003AF7162C
MASQSPKIADRPLQSPRVIVCEGSDEYDVLNWIRQRRKLTEEAVELINAEGRTKLKTVLDDLRFQSGGSAVKLVGVVLDAEEKSAADKALLDGLSSVAQAHGFGLSVHVLPDSDSAGALETLVRRHADVQTPAVACANAWELCTAENAEHRTTAQKDKAWSHVWLAGQGAFYSRLGFALANNADVRGRVPAFIEHFEKLLDQVLNTPLK